MIIFLFSLKKLSIALIVVIIIISLALFCFKFTTKSTSNSEQDNTELLNDSFQDLKVSAKDFDDVSLEIETTSGSFVGFQSIDLSLLNDDAFVSLSTTNSNETSTVRFEVSVDAIYGNVILNATLDREYGEPLIDQAAGLTIEDDQGNIDVLFIIDGTEIYLSEIVQPDVIQNVGFFSNLAKTVARVVITIVAPVITKLIAAVTLSVSILGIVDDKTAEANYQHNLKQSFKITADGFINKQAQFETWKYGLATMKNNGCGPIAVYNTLKHMNILTGVSSESGRTKQLATIVRAFEAFHGMMAFGLGGTNPTYIEPYLRLAGISSITSYQGNVIESKFYTDLESLLPNQIMILAYWWQEKSKISGHYVTITSSGSADDKFTIYNENGDENVAYTTKSLKNFIYLTPEGTRGFIRGWLVG